MSVHRENQVVIIGAGPAGLTAAYELTKHDIHPIVLEQDDKVGGIARTENYKDFHFDMGGHRFFTKSEAVNKMWHDILGDDFLLRPRLSRIFYRNKFFYYPLKYFNALSGLGLWQSVMIVLSFIKWQVFPYKKEETFEQWVTNRFGKRLFETFFKAYTEKVWGISCSELKAEWAAQRIKDLSLKTALISMLVKPNNTIKTLIEEFNYPRLGPGMLWNKVRKEVEERKGVVRLNSGVVRIRLAGKRIEHVVVSCNGSGEEIVGGTNFISSMPISEFVKRLEPVPEDVREAANRLHYRDFLTVCLVVDQPELFPDNWIYVHSPEVKVGRIQNYKNWSPHMVPDSSKTSLGLEYFCTEGDDLWNMSDSELIELAKQELERIHLANADDIIDGAVFRVSKAYPIYDSDYQCHLDLIKNFINGIENFQTIGRNGLHRYNNQDHSMVTGMLAVRNVVFGEKNDLWSVNTDPDYHEEVRMDEAKRAEKIFDETIIRVFPRLDPLSFGLASGLTSAAIIFLATLFLIIRGGEVVGPHLGLLGNFLPGYTVSLSGALIGTLQLFVLGFVAGSTFAYFRNLIVFLSARVIHRDIELRLLRRLFDFS
jgi:protoporphyrinogen oxidase